MKRIWIALIVLLVVAGLLVAGFGLRDRQARAQAGLPEDGEVYVVSRGEVVEVIEASGSLEPAAEVALGFSTPGELVEIYVATGDEVRQGEVLARLDTTDLELQLAQARAGLNAAQANLDQLLAAAREEDLTVAQSSLNQAAANAEELKVTLAANTEQARLSWEQAANALRDAQATYENIYWENREWEEEAKKWGGELPDAKADAEAQAWRAVENAEFAMEQARLAYEQALQRQESSYQSAQSQVTSAWASLERLENGAGAEEIAAVEASIEQARVAYEQAQAQLDKATLTAPFDGIVATVLGEVHNQVSAASPVLVLIDPASYYVDVEVDEVDIAAVRVGQEVGILLDAIPDVELSGTVSEIALSPSGGQGVVTYRVRVQVDDLAGAVVRSGMTANANIVTDRAGDVLVVPRRAVRLEGDQAYVEQVLPDEQLAAVPVELGLGDPYYIEIVSGLEEGDRILIRSVIQRDAAQQLIGGGPASRILGGGD